MSNCNDDIEIYSDYCYNLDSDEKIQIKKIEYLNLFKEKSKINIINLPL